MEILFIVCPYVTRHRLGSFPHCWTTFDHRCCFPSVSVPICLPLLLSVCFCPVRPPPPFSVNSLCSQVRLSGRPLPPLSVNSLCSQPSGVWSPPSAALLCFCPPSLFSVSVVAVLPASCYVHLSRFPSAYSAFRRLLPSCPSTCLVLFPFCGSLSVVLFPVCFVPFCQPW